MIYILIFILTLADVALTVWGVTKGYIEEANPLLQGVFHTSPILTGLAVILAVGLMLLFLSKQKIKWLGYAVGGLVVIKIGVLLLHVDWMVKIWGY